MNIRELVGEYKVRAEQVFLPELYPEKVFINKEVFYIECKHGITIYEYDDSVYDIYIPSKGIYNNILEALDKDDIVEAVELDGEGQIFLKKEALGKYKKELRMYESGAKSSPTAMTTYKYKYKDLKVEKYEQLVKR